MRDDIGLGPNVSRRKVKIVKNGEDRESRGSVSEGNSSDDFCLPVKRGRVLKNKSHRKLSSYASIKSELLVEKRKPRKTPLGKLKVPKSSARHDDYEDEEDPDSNMSARILDIIAALNGGKRTKVGIANCFENSTALDYIDVCLKESENMQEVALALAIATDVYSFRVDRTHNDAQETRYTFIRGKSDAEKAMLLAADENCENTKEKRRRRKVEKDPEARREPEIEQDGCDLNNIHQSEWLGVSASDTFDQTFGLKFPLKGGCLQHWSFTQELLERIQSRQLDIRKTRRAKAKIDVLEENTSAELLSDVHGVYTTMIANALRKEPTTWEHYLLEDNPRLYKTGQYLKTGDMTGYVFQERPFYHHFDPEKESADDPREMFSFVEKNADKTLYTFKKPPKGTTLARLAPFIRVPVNKYANPRNRKIEDIYFKEDIDVKLSPEAVNNCDLLRFTENAWKQLDTHDLCAADFALINFNSSTVKSTESSVVELSEDEVIFVGNNDKSLLVRLNDRREEVLADSERPNGELEQTARYRSGNIVKKCSNTITRLTRAIEEEEIDEEDLKEWRTSRFLETIGSQEGRSLLEGQHGEFSEVCTSSNSKNDELKQRRQMVASVVGAGREAFDWLVSEATILSDIPHVFKRGIHPDIRHIDAIYHMKVFKFKVTVEQAHESLRQAERIGAGMTPEELAVLKQKCFRPGRYNGIRDSGEVSRFYRTDPWSLEAATISFSEHYFGSRSYPKLEGALLQLRNDIQEAAKKIPSTSSYYATNSRKAISYDQKSWTRRLNEAISLFNSYMDKCEGKSLCNRRPLPKLPERSYNSHCQFKSARVLKPKIGCSANNSVEEEPNDTCMRQMNKSNGVPDADAQEGCYCNGNNDDDNDGGGDAGSISSFIYPDDACPGVEEEIRAIRDRSEQGIFFANRSHVVVFSQGKAVIFEIARKNFVAILSRYFTKCDVHSSVTLTDRFSIADPRLLTRSEDKIFMRRKPFTRSSFSEYKFEDFVKPGLLHKGCYPGVKLEVDESVYNVEKKFSGTLTRSSTAEEPRCDMVTPDTELDVCDAWLTTFGGFRGSPAGPVDDINLSKSENIGPNMDDSFNDSIYCPSSTSYKKDRFNDIRPDEFKAIGIYVKNLLPNKDFYAMTEEERAAAVAAEFEAIDALGPKKEDDYLVTVGNLGGLGFRCSIVPYHLNTAKMKRVMKSILSNPLLAYDKVLYSRRALLARCRAVERNKNQEFGPEMYFKKLDRTLDNSLGPIAEKMLERCNPMDITALDPVDVLDALTYRNLEDVNVKEEPKDRCETSNAGVEESMRQFAAEVRQADFKVQGLHTFSSVMHCLPRRMGNTGKHVNVANALAVTLYMCNENTLTLLQERVNTRDKNVSVKTAEPWMGNFIITNAVDNGVFND
ncbi:unnamed protein product [Angiostrongylus costaricensis]|uniref:SET domain-containing protein n=1 Tax=Angiostrongylus costaricensis TaxID=334426 RepID=A0A158PD85_ANGCS|nr:unnamed protein product [Angiostrongylus costaricensis]